MKPEGDVPTLVKWLAYHASIEPRCGDAADAIMSQATRIATLTEALRELVACKDLKNAIDDYENICIGGDKMTAAEYHEARREYACRKPFAWNAARRALSAGQGEAK